MTHEHDGTPLQVVAVKSSPGVFLSGGTSGGGLSGSGRALARVRCAGAFLLCAEGHDAAPVWRMAAPDNDDNDDKDGDNGDAPLWLHYVARLDRWQVRTISSDASRRRLGT